MANTKSALKRVRQITKRTAINRVLKTRIKNQRKAVMAAVAAGDLETASSKLRTFSSVADKAAKTHVIHRNSAARIKGNLASVVAKMGSSQ